MRQTALQLADEPTLHRPPRRPVLAAAAVPSPQDPGFQLGWDHARYGLAPAQALLMAQGPLQQGWLAARSVFAGRTLAATRWVRQWLALRLQARQQGLPFDTEGLSPQLLGQLHPQRCPVLRQPFSGLPGDPLAACYERLNPALGYVPGNLAVISQRAAAAGRGLALQDLVRRAREAPPQGEEAGLSAEAWWRLAALKACALPAQALPLHRAAALPLAMLPPPGLQPQVPALALQCQLSRMFLQPGWASRARELAQGLPAHTLRHDFNLFVGAMAPRLLAAGPRASISPAEMLHAVEDAWLHERVQRRWQHLVLCLGEAGCEALLQRTGPAQPLPAHARPGRARRDVQSVRAVASPRQRAAALLRPAASAGLLASAALLAACPGGGLPAQAPPAASQPPGATKVGPLHPDAARLAASQPQQAAPGGEPPETAPPGPVLPTR